MATRFYLPSTGTAPITNVSVSANWEVDSHGKKPCYTSKQSSAMTSFSITDADETDQDHCRLQFVSPPIAAATITVQTIKMQIRCSETNAQNQMFVALSVRVVSLDGTTVRGTVLDVTRDNLEMVLTTLTNRQFTATTSSVVASENDRLIFEIGMGGDPTDELSAGHDSRVNVGDDSGTDLAEDNGTTTANNPWIELSDTLVINAEPPSTVLKDVILSRGVIAFAR